MVSQHSKSQSLRLGFSEVCPFIVALEQCGSTHEWLEQYIPGTKHGRFESERFQSKCWCASLQRLRSVHERRFHLEHGNHGEQCQ